VLTFWLSRTFGTFVEFDQSFGWVSVEFVVQTSAIAKSGIIGVACPVLCVFYVLFGFTQLVVPPKEVNQFGKHWVLIRFLLEHALELLHSLLILVAFQQNLGQD